MNCKNLLRLKFVKGEFVVICQQKISFAVNFLVLLINSEFTCIAKRRFTFKNSRSKNSQFSNFPFHKILLSLKHELGKHRRTRKP